MLPKSLWLRLAAVIGVLVAAWLAIQFMGVSADVVTAHTLIIILAISFVIYAIIHTLGEHFSISKKQ